MTDSTLPNSWWMLSRATGGALLLRGLVLTSPLMAVGCTWLAADRTIPAIDVAVVGLAVVCAVLPDSHTGLLVVLFVGIEWLATVDDRATPWSLAAALALTVFHTSMAAASVAPPAARWTRAMSRRWLRRTGVVVAATWATWAVVALIGDHRLGGSSVLVASALVTLAFAALWARAGSLERG